MHRDRSPEERAGVARDVERPSRHRERRGVERMEVRDAAHVRLRAVRGEVDGRLGRRRRIGEPLAVGHAHGGDELGPDREAGRAAVADVDRVPLADRDVAVHVEEAREREHTRRRGDLEAQLCFSQGLRPFHRGHVG